MPSAILKKAFEGDALSMVYISHQIKEKKLSANDINELLKPSRNPNQQMLHAFYLIIQGGDNNLLKAKNMLKPLSASSNGFAAHFLSYLYYVTQENAKSNAYIEQAIDLLNPLAIVGVTNRWDFSGKVMTYAPFIFHKLIPEYQDVILDHLEQQLRNNYTPDNCYAHALCYEKMGLYEKMFEMYQKAIEYKPSGENKSAYVGKSDIYRHKLVKKFEKLAHENHYSLFKLQLNRSYVDKRLEGLLKKLKQIDAKLANGPLSKDELLDLEKSMKSIKVAAKNYKYILEENSFKSSAKHLQVTIEKWKRLQTIRKEVKLRLKEAERAYQDEPKFRKREY